MCARVSYPLRNVTCTANAPRIRSPVIADKTSSVRVLTTSTPGGSAAGPFGPRSLLAGIPGELYVRSQGSTVVRSDHPLGPSGRDANAAEGPVVVSTSAVDRGPPG